jgi:hypothetical protein
MLKRKSTFIAAFLIAGAMAAAAYVHAARTEMTEIIYFDAQGDIVGEVLFPCAGRVQSWGITTDDYHIETFPCL